VVLNPRQIQFREYKDLTGHLNTWAAQQLVSPEAWADVLVASRQWLDYSGRNQVLLASYSSVEGPVAGTETWRLVPSTTDGRMCAVRGGEHGWPVRVPITTRATEPDPYLGGSRPTRAAVERWEWRPVFSIDQLARRPAPGALVAVDVPESLMGRRADHNWLEASRTVARQSMRTAPSETAEPEKLMADASARLSRRSKGPDLEREHHAQVAWLVADRVGMARGELPSFDPEPFQPRDRWPMLQNVLDMTRKLTGVLGVAVGVDLTASPLPRMEIVDDRAVPAGSRRRLPAASLANLPLGQWEHLGPYTADEWASRGEHGAGRGAYLRLDHSSYLVAIEDGDSATWRLEDGRAPRGRALEAQGEASSLAEAEEDAIVAVRHRFPELANQARGLVQDDMRSRGDTPAQSDVVNEWHQVPGEGNSSAQQRHLAAAVTVFAFPGPGGRWLPAVQDSDGLTHLPYARTLDDAQDAAEQAGRRAALLASLDSPAQLDRIVSGLAVDGEYSRADLVALVGTQLLPAQQERLAVQDLAAPELVDLLGRAGLTPATTARVLHVEGADADQVAALLPIAGVPMDESIQMLHELWELPRADAARRLGANAIEMRAAGCSVDEVLSIRPQEVLRALPDDPHTWELAAGTMAQTVPLPRVVSHLVAHAPSAQAFAAGLAAAAGLDDGIHHGFATAVRFGAQGEQLAATCARYDLEPETIATLLADAGAAPQVAVETLYWSTEFDPQRTADLAGQHLGLDHDDIADHLGIAASLDEMGPNSRPERHLTLVHGGVDTLAKDHEGEELTHADEAGSPAVSSLDPTNPADLLRILPDPEPVTASDPMSLLDMLPDPQPVEVGLLDLGDHP
jgi:hypothetical protein